MADQSACKVPLIRFKGFGEAWHERKLGEICESLSYGLNAAAAKFDGINKYLRITDIDDKTRNFSSTSLTTPGVSIDDCENYVLTQGDIVFARTGASVGKTYIYKKNDGRVFFAGFLIRAKIKPDTDENFVFQNTLTFKYNKFVTLVSQRSGQPGINAQEYRAYALNLPKFDEQTKIGSYFRGLDQLIELHQRKHDKLAALKKAMLQKMFPKPGAAAPEIRFKGFSKNWGERKLGEVMANIANNTLSRANLNPHSGLAKNVHYGDILVQFGEVLDIQNNRIPFITNDAVAKKLTQSNLKNGDVVLADAAEDEMVGKCTEIQNVGNQVVLAGLHTIPLRPLCHFEPFYLGYYLNSDGYHHQLLPIMQGTKVLSISKAAIKQTAIRFPHDKVEQQKIGAYFRNLDALISQHAIQLQKLQQIKSACLEKMFV